MALSCKFYDYDRASINFFGDFYRFSAGKFYLKPILLSLMRSAYRNLSCKAAFEPATECGYGLRNNFQRFLWQCPE
jgi:hypothetical protein